LTAASSAKGKSIVSDKDKLKAQLQGIESALAKLEDEYKKGVIDIGRYLKLKAENEASKAELEQELGGLTRGQGAVAPTLSKRAPLAEIRKLLNRTFDAVELDIFCMDNFPTVYDRFGAGMRKDAKIQLLMDHCRRHELFGELLSVLEEHD